MVLPNEIGLQSSEDKVKGAEIFLHPHSNGKLLF